MTASSAGSWRAVAGSKFSLLNLHWVNDLPGALLQVRRALKPDGLFLAALLGGETLKELRGSLLEAESEIEGGAGPRVSPFADVRDVAGPFAFLIEPERMLARFGRQHGLVVYDLDQVVRIRTGETGGSAL